MQSPTPPHGAATPPAPVVFDNLGCGHLRNAEDIYVELLHGGHIQALNSHHAQFLHSIAERARVSGETLRDVHTRLLRDPNLTTLALMPVLWSIILQQGRIQIVLENALAAHDHNLSMLSGEIPDFETTHDLVHRL